MIQVKIPQALLDNFNDEMTTFTLDTNFRGAIFDAGAFVTQLKYQHNLNPLQTLCLGHGALCAAMFIPMMKGHERVAINYKTDGAILGFSVEACSEGWVRGYLLDKNISITGPLTSWDLAPFFGEGFLSVTRYPENSRTPITGTVAITHKNIAQDLTEYFLQSEQTETAIASSIKFDRDGNIAGAAAYFIQVLPGASDEEVERLQQTLSKLPSPAAYFERTHKHAVGTNATEVFLKDYFSEFNTTVLLSRDVSFYCPCSAAAFLAKIRALPKSDTDKLLSDETVEVQCQNCGSVYRFTRENLKAGRL